MAKPSEILRVAGRPIAYYPSLTKLTGGVTATVFLCQLLYWQGKGADQDGWIYKNQKEWEDETGLSETEQRHARKILGLLRVLDEREAGIPCRLWYRVNTDRLDELWEKMLDNKKAETLATSSDKSSEPVAINPRNKKTETMSTITETTQRLPEKTTEIAPIQAQPVRRNRKPLCEANQVHWDTTKRRLNDKQLAAIEATVTDVPLWQHLLDDWLMCGYNPGNVNGLLAAYQAGGLKTGRSQGGSYAGNRRHSQPDDTDSGWGVAPGTVRWADGAKPLDDDLFPVQGGGVGGAGQTTP